MPNMVGFRPMLWQPADLLREAILAYAAGQEAAPVTLAGPDQDIVTGHLHRILDGAGAPRGRRRMPR
jgi:hypothetical protein